MAISLKSQHGCNILSTHIPFGSMSIHLLIPMIELFKYLTFKIQGKSRHNILSTHIPFVPCWSAAPFLKYSYFKNWPWKSKVKVMGEVKLHSHNVSLTSYRLTSLCSMSIGPPIPEIQHFQNLSLKIQGQSQMTMMLHNYMSRKYMRYGFRKVWTQFVANLTSFWPMGNPIWGKWAHDHNSAQLQA